MLIACALTALSRPRACARATDAYLRVRVRIRVDGDKGRGDDLNLVAGRTKDFLISRLLCARVTLETKESCRAASATRREGDSEKEIAARTLPIKRIQRVVGKRTVVGAKFATERLMGH